MPITAKMFPALISDASREGADAFGQGAESARQAQRLKLEKYLKEKAPELAGQEQAAKNKSNLDTLDDPRLQKYVNDTGSVKVGDLTVGADPAARMAGKAQSGDEAAMRHAVDFYNHGQGKIQDSVSAATEGLDVVNDPHNPGSLGQARTLALKAMGMNRYNEKEAEAVVPPTLRGTISNLFNKGGDDTSPLNEASRAALNQFFRAQLEQTKAKHDTLKNGAYDTYGLSLYSSPARKDSLKSTLGRGLDDTFSSVEKRYAQVPQAQAPNLTQAPNPTPLDNLMAKFGGLRRGQAQPAPAPAPQPMAAPQAPAAPGLGGSPAPTPTGTPMTFEQWKASKNATPKVGP